MIENVSPPAESTRQTAIRSPFSPSLLHSSALSAPFPSHSGNRAFLYFALLYSRLRGDADDHNASNHGRFYRRGYDCGYDGPLPSMKADYNDGCIGWSCDGQAHKPRAGKAQSAIIRHSGNIP